MDRNSIIKSLFKSVEKNETECFKLIRELCSINTITGNRENTLNSFNIIKDTIKPLGFSSSILEENHPILISKNEVKRASKRLLLLAHIDTVSAVGKNKIIELTEDDENFYGTGVLDMKGGIAEIISVCKALNDIDLLKSIPITIFINSDEEIGSPLSRKNINELSSESLAAFVFESSNDQRQLITSRVGKILYELSVYGIARHVSDKGTDKYSAIEELAHKIIEIEKLNKTLSDASLNVGVVDGGTAPNVVAPFARATIDVRFSNNWVKESLVKKLHEITNRNLRDKTVSELWELNSRPPMLNCDANQKLIDTFKKNGALFDLNLFEIHSFSASDGCFPSASTIPVIDGIGPVGNGAHSNNEFMIKKSFTLKSKLTAVSIIDFIGNSNLKVC